MFSMSSLARLLTYWYASQPIAVPRWCIVCPAKRDTVDAWEITLSPEAWLSENDARYGDVFDDKAAVTTLWAFSNQKAKSAVTTIAVMLRGALSAMARQQARQVGSAAVFDYELGGLESTTY
ncbi:hypothetical protein SCAR479_06481 [Seiridium cardinale]|uniref:Uncharacterized protein n=1 Tax=Seiridium cardinale TaxID=138064 RepID=A0ABR2XSG9_9PEZI